MDCMHNTGLTGDLVQMFKDIANKDWIAVAKDAIPLVEDIKKIEDDCLADAAYDAMKEQIDSMLEKLKDPKQLAIDMAHNFENNKEAVLEDIFEIGKDVIEK